MELNFIELLGYIASILVMLSFIMSGVFKLRVINTVGASLFCIYGFIIHAYPVGIVNFIIVCANIYYLTKMFKNKSDFSLVELSPNNSYLKHFIDTYIEEMKKNFLENYTFDQSKYDYSFLILQDMSVMGILLCQKYDKNSLLIDIDYTIKGHHDLKAGDFVYNKNKQFFKDLGFDFLMMEPQTELDAKYVESMGFLKEDSSNIYKLAI